MKLFDTEFWEVELINEQSNLGRCVVDLKRECKELSLVTKEEFIDLHNIIQRLERTFKEKFNATMFNWTCLMNDSYKDTNDEIPQVHFHFRPRYKEGITLNGELFCDENFAHHYNNKSRKIVSDEILKTIKEKFLN